MIHDIPIKHHQHIRKRIYKKLEEYPNPNKLKNFIDKLVYISGFFGLIMTIPQITKIWIEKNASGISVISWMSYFITGAIMISYGIIHKEKPIAIIYCFWEIFYLLIIIGTLLYG